jgi:hypothetical protein
MAKIERQIANSQRKAFEEQSLLKRKYEDLAFFLTPRYLIGLALIVAAFLSAFILSKSSDRSIEVWGAVNNLAPGQIIDSSDIEIRRVWIAADSDRYLSSTAQIIGTVVTRDIGVAELIPSYALTKSTDIEKVEVPISVLAENLPAGLSRGDRVDIYITPNREISIQARGATTRPARLLINDAVIEYINLKEIQFQEDILITLLLDREYVYPVISSKSDHNFIISKVQYQVRQ